jgi:hypothetical protein
MIIVILPSVIKLSVVIPSVYILVVGMLWVIILSGVIPRVLMLSVIFYV